MSRRGSFAQLPVLFPMELVHDAMHERREQERGRRDEYEPGVQRIEAREYLAAIRVRRVDGTHAARDHRAVEEGVAPREPLEVLITRHPDGKGHHDERQSGGGMAQHATYESSAREKRVGSRLVHGARERERSQRTRCNVFFRSVSICASDRPVFGWSLSSI